MIIKKDKKKVLGIKMLTNHAVHRDEQIINPQLYELTCSVW